jgi:hypothetical protein
MLGRLRHKWKDENQIETDVESGHLIHLLYDRPPLAATFKYPNESRDSKKEQKGGGEMVLS